MQMLLDAVGELSRPKVKAVVLPAGETALRMGLFSVNQGRLPGRMRDFSNSLKLGGLIVDAGKVPSLGLFEYRRDIGEDEPSSLPWKNPVQQILRTDGRDWLALARNPGTGKLETAERFTLPDFVFGLERAVDRYDGALFDAPQDVFGFVEFLRRALMLRHDPAGAAARTASHGRELVFWFMASDETWLERFVAELRERLQLTIATLAPELRAAQILAGCILLEEMMFQAPRLLVRHPPQLAGGRLAEAWFSPSAWSADPVPGKIIQAAAETMFPVFQTLVAALSRSSLSEAARTLDAGLAEFCLDFWRELEGGKSGDTAAITETTRQVDRDWANDFLYAVGQGFPAVPAIVDIGAGIGDRLLEAVAATLSIDGPVSLHAFEPDPVAGGMLRLRLLMLRALCQQREKPCQTFFHGEPEGVAAALSSPAGAHPILFCDCMPESLSRAKPLSNMAAERVGAVLDLLDGADSFPASLRLPAGFLDGSEHAAERKRLAGAGRPLWVKCDWNRERPKDKRLAQAPAIVLLLAGGTSPKKLPEGYERTKAIGELRFSFLPHHLSDEYLSWPALPELAAVPPMTGPIERRGLTLIDSNLDALSRRMNDYFSGLPDKHIASFYPPMMTDRGTFKAWQARQKIKARTAFAPERLTAYPFRSFDCRFAYLHDLRPLFSDPAPNLYTLTDVRDNWFLVAGEDGAGTGGGVPAWASPIPCDYDFFAGRSRHFPVWFIPGRPADGRRRRRKAKEKEKKANLSTRARRLLALMGCHDPDGDEKSASVLWDFALAVLYTPAYLKAHQDALRLGWPRLPLPDEGMRPLPAGGREAFMEYAALGGEVRRLLSGRESTMAAADLPCVAAIGKERSHPPVPPASLSDTDRTLSAGWGVPAKWSAVRPQPGKAVTGEMGRECHARLVGVAETLGISAGDCFARLGGYGVTAYLNADVYWTNIPLAAWDYTIGGRRVLSKWLSYRDAGVTHRPLMTWEMESFADTARRLTLLALLGIKLDRLWLRWLALIRNSNII